MRNIYAMIIVTVLFFVLSFDIIFYTNVFFDITLVIIYLILVGQSALNLETDITEVRDEYILGEKITAYFVPMTLMPFLGMAYKFGYIMFSINMPVP